MPFRRITRLRVRYAWPTRSTATRGFRARDSTISAPAWRFDQTASPSAAGAIGLLQNGDALEEVLVEGDDLLFGAFLVGLRAAGAGDDEQLRLALPAELAVQVVLRAAELADQSATRSPPGPAYR